MQQLITMRRLAPTPFKGVIVRLIMFCAAGAFGAIPLITTCWWNSLEIEWHTVALAAGVMGTFAALFGRKFWEIAVDLWP